MCICWQLKLTVNGENASPNKEREYVIRSVHHGRFLLVFAPYFALAAVFKAVLICHSVYIRTPSVTSSSDVCGFVLLILCQTLNTCHFQICFGFLAVVIGGVKRDKILRFTIRNISWIVKQTIELCWFNVIMKAVRAPRFNKSEASTAALWLLIRGENKKQN